MYGLEKLERAEADIPRTMTDQADQAEEKERERESDVGCLGKRRE